MIIIKKIIGHKYCKNLNKIKRNKKKYLKQKLRYFNN